MSLVEMAAGLCQRFRPFKFGGCMLRTSLSRRQVRRAFVEFRLVLPRVDFKQQVALLDRGPAGEQHFFEFAADAGANVDRLARFDTADEIHRVGHVANHRPADGHFRHGRRRSGSGAAGGCASL